MRIETQQQPTFVNKNEVKTLLHDQSSGCVACMLSVVLVKRVGLGRVKMFDTATRVFPRDLGCYT